MPYVIRNKTTQQYKRYDRTTTSDINKCKIYTSKNGAKIWVSENSSDWCNPIKKSEWEIVEVKIELVL